MFVDHANREREVPGFTGYLADTPESRRIHHRIRYHVYCERKGFEDDAVLRRRGLERDAYDGHSLPFIFRDEYDGQWRGTARLVVRRATRLPVEDSGAVPPHFCSRYPAGSVAEFSRVAALTPPHIAGRDRWGLLKTTLASVLITSKQGGIDDLLFLITPSLARVITRMGIAMQTVGHPIQHRGERQAYLGNVSGALNSLRAKGVVPSLKLHSETEGTLPADQTLRATALRAPIPLTGAVEDSAHPG